MKTKLKTILTTSELNSEKILNFDVIKKYNDTWSSHQSPETLNQWNSIPWISKNKTKNKMYTKRI